MIAVNNPTTLADALIVAVVVAGRWAWLLDDVKPTTARCPKCWGAGGGRYFPQDDSWCRQCDAAGTCPPIPAKGRLGFWTWQP